MRIAIIAALPGELKPLVRGWQRMPVVRGSGIKMWQTIRGEDEVVAVCGGMGAAAARRAFVAAEFLGSLDAVLSVGWAGALEEECRAGECYGVSEVVDAQTGERFAVGDGVRLVTTVHVAVEREKARLAASYGAGLVDMEAAPVARLAQMRGIPMRCFKGVSDGAGMMLPDINPYIDDSGQLKMVGFLGYVVMRPLYWGALLQLGRNSGVAAKALAVRIEGFLKERSWA